MTKNGIRITIVLDKDLNTELRKDQAKQIKKSEHTVSFSSVLNQFVRKGLKL